MKLYCLWVRCCECHQYMYIDLESQVVYCSCEEFRS